MDGRRRRNDEVWSRGGKEAEEGGDVVLILCGRQEDRGTEQSVQTHGGGYSPASLHYFSNQKLEVLIW
jgi:hypothetical protein